MWRFDFNQTTRTHPSLLIICKWYLLFFTSKINVFSPLIYCFKLLLLRVHVINYMYYIFPLNVCFKLHLALKSNVIIKITFEIIAMIHMGFISFFFPSSILYGFQIKVILSIFNLHKYMKLTKHKNARKCSRFLMLTVYVTFNKICCMMMNS